VSTRVMIDLNVRVHGNATYVGFEDVDGPIAVGDEVVVFEPESGLEGSGRIVEIDADNELVYLSVDWAGLRPAATHSPVNPQLVETYMIIFTCTTAAPVACGGDMHRQAVTASPVICAA